MTAFHRRNWRNGWGLKVDGMSKHMQVLQDREAVQQLSLEGGDGRALYEQIPQCFRATTGSGRLLLDYGGGVIWFGR